MIHRRLLLTMALGFLNKVAWTISKWSQLGKKEGLLLENHFYLRKIHFIMGQ